MAQDASTQRDIRPAAHVMRIHGDRSDPIPMDRDLIVIGRDPHLAQVVLNDMSVSRRHAHIAWRDDHFMLEDLGSSNGTTLNGRPLTNPRPLRSGDMIEVGNAELRFQVRDGVVASPPDSLISTIPVPDGRPRPSVVPARVVMDSAARTNTRLGHENLGFLSETHGFLPTTAPRLALPPSHAAWDDVAARLPDLWRGIRVRQELDALPVLSADVEALGDEHLLRASVIMSILAHAYHRISDFPPDGPMPPGVQRPWEEITRRLDRRGPHLSYIDLILNNWRFIDPDAADPFHLSNLQLLVSTVENQEEEVLYLMQVEAHHRIAPVTAAIVRAHEAVHRDDVDALRSELISITDTVQEFGRVFMALNPNPYSDTFVDPVIWAKTVAPFAVPISEDAVGPSGVSAPVFHMLDVFFGRHHYNTHLGEEMLNMRTWYPKHWRDFFDALSELSVARYVEERNDSVLQGVWKEAALGYAGEHGFLSVHKLKAYGYLDIAFKVGRSVTIGGFKGLFKDRVWDDAVDQLATAQNERAADFPTPSHHAPITSIETVNSEGDPSRWVKRIVLDVSGTGIRYRPGDRCAVLPENDDSLIDRTLVSLGAKGYEEVTLNGQWRAAVTSRHGYADGADSLPLRTLLRFGQIRPVHRQVAKALYLVSLNSRLGRIVTQRAEDQWELWDLLDLMSDAGFDPKVLWRAHPGERAHICRIVRPELARMYSISSTMEGGTTSGAQELALTVGRLSYVTGDGALSHAAERRGTASHFLGDTSHTSPEGRGHVSLNLVHPARFDLPEDPRTPIAMFAGGTGIAPFMGFLSDRDARDDVGDTWLFVGNRTREEFLYAEQLAPMVAKGWLHVRPAFSRDPVDTRFVQNGEDGGQFEFSPGEQRYVDAEMLREDNAQVLSDLIRSTKDGGAGGHLYVCGRTGFADSVMRAVKEILRSTVDRSVEDVEAQASQMLYRLLGEERYKQDIFSTYTGSHIDQQSTFDASEIVLHNNPTDGFWMVIDGRVYDMTEFGHLHPGGFRIIHSYAGMDGTQAYQKVQHHLNPEVDSMLGMYELGVVRRLDFGMEWGTCVGPDGLRFLWLADLYRTWIHFLYNVVEMENALHNDYSLKGRTIIGDDSPDAYPPIKLQYLLEVHDRFLLNFLSGTTGETLQDLWAVTCGMTSEEEDARWAGTEVTQITGSVEAATVQRLSREVQQRIDVIVAEQLPEDDPAVALVKELCALFEREDSRFLREMKRVTRDGVMVLEAFEQDTVKLGGRELLAAAKRFPAVLESYHARLTSGALTVLLDRPETS